MMTVGQPGIDRVMYWRPETIGSLLEQMSGPHRRQDACM